MQGMNREIGKNAERDDSTNSKEGGIMNATQLVLKDHAYERYCERVGPIDRDELTKQLERSIHHPNSRKREYIQLDGVWWRFDRQDKVVTLHTCYGRHHYDLPAAIKWAKRYRDRIDLNGD